MGLEWKEAWPVPNAPFFRHLAWLIVVKLALLAAIWFAFVQPSARPVDSARALAHMTTAAP